MCQTRIASLMHRVLKAGREREAGFCSKACAERIDCTDIRQLIIFIEIIG